MSLLGKSLTCHPKEIVNVLSKRLKEKLEQEKSFERKKPLQNKGGNKNKVNTDFVLRLFDEITTYFKTTSEYHYIPNLKDGIYPLTRPTSEQLAAIN